jgi:uncharacterized protein YkwD
MKALLIVALLAFAAVTVRAEAEAEELEVDVSEEMLTEVGAGEADVLKWLNVARTNPKAFAAKLAAEVLVKFAGKIYHHASGDIMTNEGIAAVKSAIQVLSKTRKMKPLTFASGLNKAALRHAKDQGSKGLFAHNGSDGKDPFQRMSLYGKWSGMAAENMASGYKGGFDIVAQLIIDDGVSSRGHRKNILNPKLLKVGIATQPHKTYRWICVQDFATSFVSKK